MEPFYQANPTELSHICELTLRCWDKLDCGTGHEHASVLQGTLWAWGDGQTMSSNRHRHLQIQPHLPISPPATAGDLPLLL
jgi:hypothetical protein